MKINWKEVAASEGYRSLKKAYIDDVQDAARTISKGRRPMRDKAEFLKHFNWVISRAVHYAHHQNRSIIEVLNGWEADRTYWWLNYYRSHKQPRLNKNGKKHYTTLRGEIRVIKRAKFHSKKSKAAQVMRVIARRQEFLSTKVKKRYTPKYKKDYHELVTLRSKRKSVR